MLTPEAREDRYAEIIATAIVSVVIGHVRRIDRDNILQASLWGMRVAYRGLGVPAGSALIDGNIIPKRFPCPARAVVGGDGLSLSVAAASIVAKVTRDRMMVKLSRRYRRYGWESNKGYGTRQHAAAIEKHGVCTHHRRSFSPIERALRLLDNGAELPAARRETSAKPESKSAMRRAILVGARLEHEHVAVAVELPERRVAIRPCRLARRLRRHDLVVCSRPGTAPDR